MVFCQPPPFPQLPGAPSLPGFLRAEYSPLAHSFLCLPTLLEHWGCSRLSSRSCSFSPLSLPPLPRPAPPHLSQGYQCHLQGSSSPHHISSPDSLQVPDSWDPLPPGELRFKTELWIFLKQSPPPPHPLCGSSYRNSGNLLFYLLLLQLHPPSTSNPPLLILPPACFPCLRSLLPPPCV